MIDKRQQEIKEKMQKYAMDLWGISDPRQVDPIVDLLLDIFAYNTNRLYQDIDASNTNVLHRLAHLLVPQKWSLPSPSHALMTVLPAKDQQVTLTPEDHFFTDKMIFGKGQVRINFTPLSTYRLIDAEVKCTFSGTTLSVYSENGVHSAQILDVNDKTYDGSIWVGLDIADKELQTLEELTLCILPENKLLCPFIQTTEVFDVNGTLLHTYKPVLSQEHSGNTHYFNDINDFYEDHYLTIKLTGKAKAKRTLTDLFDSLQGEELMSIQDNRLIWFRLKFADVFDDTQINSIKILTNTFPVVNRQLNYKNHSFLSQGRIISILCDKETHFLHMNDFHDNLGREYVSNREHFNENPEGSYSLYFGSLERFDSDNARSLMIKLIQLIREDGNAFTSMNPERLTSKLKEIYNKLENIEKGLYDVIQAGNKVRGFLLTIPFKNADNAEFSYWVTNGAIANGLDHRTLLCQTNTEKFKNRGIMFQTTTVQGAVHQNEQDLINSLRYGLLSNDRIVTREDVRSYIYHRMGAYIEALSIEDGVAISPDKKKGLIRTTEIKIRIKRTVNTDALGSIASMNTFLEKELSKRSISNTPYKVSIQ